MKEKANPLAGLVEQMVAHDARLAQKQAPKPVATPEPPKAAATPIQTVATVEPPHKIGNKVYCAARYTRGQIAKVDQIILLTHSQRGVRITQSDVLKKAIDRLPIAPLDAGEVAEILAESKRKLLNG